MAIAALAGLAPISQTLREKLPKSWASRYPRLGLDLQGGIHLVLRVEADKAIENRLDRLAEDMTRQAKEQKVEVASIVRDGTGGLVARGVSADGEQKLQELIQEDFYGLTPNAVVGDTMNITLSDPEKQRIRDYAVDQSLETIRNRVDQLGLTEPVIQRQGNQRILVQMPGLDNPERALDIIGKTAQLEFKVVATDQSRLADAVMDPAKVPEGMELLYERRRDPATGRALKSEPLLVEKKVLMTGDALANAEVRISTRMNFPIVGLDFTAEGARQFDAIAAAIVGRRLAIILDGTIYSAPSIKQAHYGGKAIIEGSFTDEEARDLALVLRAGALPAPVKILEKRAVGATLGHDSIQAGTRAMAIGFSAVVIFMIFYYKASGIIADLTLMLNVALIIASMSMLQATLTLPGLAGLVLTVGMAVDGNVIIYERIREELRLGKAPRAAVEAGYSKALSTILDANITTLIAAVVLFQFGTGPVKGFAVTLSIGIVWSVITVVFASRVIFDWLVTSRRVQTLSI